MGCRHILDMNGPFWPRVNKAPVSDIVTFKCCSVTLPMYGEKASDRLNWLKRNNSGKLFQFQKKINWDVTFSCQRWIRNKFLVIVFTIFDCLAHTSTGERFLICRFWWKSQQHSAPDPHHKVQKSTVSFDLLLVTSSQPSRYLQNVTAQSFVMFIFAQKRPCENRGRKKWKSTETLKRTPSVMHSKIHSGYKQLCGGQTIDCYFTDTVWSDMLHMVVSKSWNLHQEWHHSFFNALTLAMWATTQRVLCIHHTENEHSGSGR